MRCHSPVRINPVNGQTVRLPVFRIFIFTPFAAAKYTALYSLRCQSPYLIRELIIICLDRYVTCGLRRQKLFHREKVFLYRSCCRLSFHVLVTHGSRRSLKLEETYGNRKARFYHRNKRMLIIYSIISLTE